MKKILLILAILMFTGCASTKLDENLYLQQGVKGCVLTKNHKFENYTCKSMMYSSDCSFEEFYVQGFCENL